MLQRRPNTNTAGYLIFLWSLQSLISSWYIFKGYVFVFFIFKINRAIHFVRNMQDLCWVCLSSYINLENPSFIITLCFSSLMHILIFYFVKFTMYALMLCFHFFSFFAFLKIWCLELLHFLSYFRAFCISLILTNNVFVFLSFFLFCFFLGSFGTVFAFFWTVKLLSSLKYFFVLHFLSS